MDFTEWDQSFPNNRLLASATVDRLRHNAYCMVTVHPEGAPGSSSAVKAELSLNTFQSLSTGYLNYQMAQADNARTPMKPVVNGEARYEGEDGTTAFDRSAVERKLKIFTSRENNGEVATTRVLQAR